MGKELVVHCRGLPWECTEEMLRDFFGNKDIENVSIPRSGNRASGEGFVTFTSEEEYEKALDKNKEYMGKRYIEVFPMKNGPYESDRRHTKYGRPPRHRVDSFSSRDARPRGSDGIIRLRGLPFSCTIRDIVDFFAPLAIVRNGVLLPDQRQSRNFGEAYVVFEHPDSAQVATQRHMKNMGHRYIEVFLAGYNEMLSFCDINCLAVPRTATHVASKYERGNGYSRNGEGHASYASTHQGYSGSGYYESSGYLNSYDSIPPETDKRYDDYSRGSHLYDNGNGYMRKESSMGSGDPESVISSQSWESNGSSGNHNYPVDHVYGQREGGGPERREHGKSRHREAPYSRSTTSMERSPHFVLRMRGVPYRATTDDIKEFFHPLRPDNVELLRDNSGRPSGEARAIFYSRKDYDDALLKDREYLGERYIEIIPDTGRY